jgi:hypothetical protein
MSSALSWLEKKGIAAKPKKGKDKDKMRMNEIPSAREAEAALDKLKLQGLGRKKSKIGKEEDEKTPSNKEMEKALSWLKIRDSKKIQSEEDNEARIGWKGRWGEAKKILLGEQKPRWLQKRVAALHQPDENSKRERREGGKSITVRPEDEAGNVPSWKQKLSAAMKKLFAEDGETRPSWMQRRVDAINRGGRGGIDLSKSPSAEDMENALSWVEKEKRKPKSFSKPKLVDTAQESPAAPLDWMEHGDKGRTSMGSKPTSKRESSLEQTKDSPEDTPSLSSKTEMEKALKYLYKSENAAKSKKEVGNSDTSQSSPTTVNMEKTLKGLNNKAGSGTAKTSQKNLYPIQTSSPKKVGSSNTQATKKDQKDMTQVEIDYENALIWLTTEKADSMEDIAYFKKLDSILPKRESQTQESRAKEMSRAMKWVKKQDISDSKSGSKDIASPKRSKSDKERKIEKSNNGEGSKRDTSTPGKQRKSLSAKDFLDSRQSLNTAKKGKSVLRKELFLPKRQKRPLPQKPSKKHVSDFKKSDLSGQEKRDFENAVAWLISDNKEGLEDSNYFKKLDFMLPKKPNQSTEHRAKEMARALEWVRTTSGVKSDKPKESSARSKKDGKDEKEDRKEAKKEKLKKESKKDDKWKKLKKNVDVVKQIPKKQEEKEKLTSIPTIMLDKDAENALTWLKADGTGNLEDAANFKKVDSMLAKKPGQPMEDRAVAMAKMLKFLRKKGMDVRQEDTKQTGKESSQGQTDELSQKRDLEHDVNYLKAKREGKAVSKLKFLRKKGMDVRQKVIKQTVKESSQGQTDELSQNRDLEHAGKESSQGQTDELSQNRNLEHAVNYLKAKKEGKDVSKLEDAISFQKLENMLPKKVNQEIEDRAQEMVKMLAWLRKKGKMNVVGKK